MIDCLFVTVYLIFPIIILLILKTFRMNLLVVSIPTVVIIYLFVFNYIGLLPLYFGWVEDKYYEVQDRTIIFQIYLCTSWVILSLVTGFIFVKNVLKFEMLNNYICSLRTLNRKETILLILLFFICLIVFIIYLQKVPRIAFFSALYDGIRESRLDRSNMTNAFIGKYHWYKLFMGQICFLLTFIFLPYMYIKKSYIHKALFIIMLLLSTFVAIMQTQKAPLINLLIGLYLVYIIVKKKGLITVRTLIKFVILIILILTVLYVYFMGSPDVGSSLYSIFVRTFMGQIVPVYYYLEFFPNYHDFLMGMSFPNPASILPYVPYRLAVEVMNWKFPGLEMDDIVGSAPTIFWGELYANFGFIGVFLIPFFVGIFIYTVSVIIDKLENTLIKIGFVVWLILHYSKLSSTGLSSFIVDFELAIISLILIIITVMANGFKIKLGKVLK